MVKNFQSWLLLFAALPLLSGCSAIGTIFKAGMWWGIILVCIIMAIIVWVVSRSRK